MTHTVREKQKLINRIRRIRGQIEGIEKMLEEERGCADVLHGIAGLRGAITGLMGEVIEDHLHMHVVAPDLTAAERHDGAAELAEALRMYLK